MSQPTKKLVNTVQECVEDCLQGLVGVNPGLQILHGHRVVIRSDIDEIKKKGQVTLVSGGGSGHEPAHAGYIGPGMLSGAVAGAVFTSPPPNSILAAIRTVGNANTGGTLLIIKNYTGDRLNFGIAAERAKAEGMKVEMVVVGEDCALTSADKSAGRRGLAGTVFIHKMAGAMAEEGKSLSDITTEMNAAVKDMGTIGISLAPCSVPGSGPSFHLRADEMELGLGIHGEAGVKRLKMSTAKDSVNTMLEHMTNKSSATHLPLEKGNKVALMINNLGGTSVLEMNIIAKEAILWLENKGIQVDRAHCGSFMTALEMAGVSLTVMKLNDSRTRLLDAPTAAPGWCKPLLVKGQTTRKTPVEMTSSGEKEKTDTTTCAEVQKETAVLIYKVVSEICDVIGKNEQHLNDLDTQSGDGDCGSTLKRGTDEIKKCLGSIDSPGLEVLKPRNLLLSLAHIIEKDMGGSSGALYSLFLSAAASQVTNAVSVQDWCSGLEAGIKAIMKYGGAEVGDRTMLDALYPACETLKSQLSSGSPVTALAAAVEAAEKGASSTTTMNAKAGRASYVSKEYLKQPDPGAFAVGVWMRAVYEVLKQI